MSLYSPFVPAKVCQLGTDGLKHLLMLGRLLLQEAAGPQERVHRRKSVVSASNMNMILQCVTASVRGRWPTPHTERAQVRSLTYVIRSDICLN